MLSSIARACRPGLLPTVAVLVLLPVLLSLGRWQLDRAEQKRQWLAAYARMSHAEPLPAADLPEQADPAFLRVRLDGHFDAAHSLLLDSALRDGKPGVELLQPFQDRVSGLWILVNRGWMPWPDRRTPPVFETPQGPLQAVARVHVPDGHLLTLAADDLHGAWPHLVNAADAPAVWQQLGYSGYPQVLRLEAGPAAYRVDWPIVTVSPERHTGYAVQWFGLAATLLILYFYLGWHRARELRHEPVPHTR